MDVVRLKKDMKSHIGGCKEELARMNVGSSFWGIGARRNAYRITKKHTGSGSTTQAAVYKVLHPALALHIIPVEYDWANPLVKRDGSPPHVIWHHAAANNLTPQAIHSYDIHTNGWSGFGYHFYVRKDGKVYRGRPEAYMGAHARGYNDSLGVCAEGNFMSDYMPIAQLNAMKALHYYLHHKYPRATDLRHKDVNATACPGLHYPMEKIMTSK